MSALNTACLQYSQFISNLSKGHDISLKTYSFYELYKTAYTMGSSDQKVPFMLEIFKIVANNPTLSDKDIESIKDVLVYIENTSNIDIISLLKFARGTKK